MMKITIMSQQMFDDRMQELGLCNDNVEGSGMAFFSIIGTEECLKYYLEAEDTVHYFSNGHPNVLNLEFDDVSDNLMYKGHLFMAMNDEQCKEAVRFIKEQVDNGVNEIIGHCWAGVSRSRAFAEFICRYCEDHGVEFKYEDREHYASMLNQGVLVRLMRAYREAEENNKK